MQNLGELGRVKEHKQPTEQDIKLPVIMCNYYIKLPVIMCTYDIKLPVIMCNYYYKSPRRLNLYQVFPNNPIRSSDVTPTGIEKNPGC